MTTFSTKELYLDNSTKPDKTTWAALIGKYQTSPPWRSVGQAVNTFIPFSCYGI